MLAWASAPILAHARESDRPRLAVGVLPGDLRLDGDLDEPAWAAAPAIDDLVMVEPRQGERPTGRTAQPERRLDG